MREILRKIHLYAGLAAAAFLMMYFVTGLALVHESWFPRTDPERTVRSERLELKGNLEPEQLASVLELRFGIRGKRLAPRGLPDGSWQLDWMRPGLGVQARVWASGDSLTLTTTRQGLRGTLVGFHRLHGYGGGALYDLWAFMYDFSSAALILFAASGLWIWFGRREKSGAGWLCLAAGLGLTAAMVLYFLLMP
ncbi:PepSY-associated TM helix domain-containing protein [bacterium]|nr:PepSY-associated TM helix domain-containing protein [bacterium]